MKTLISETGAMHRSKILLDEDKDIIARVLDDRWCRDELGMRRFEVRLQPSVLPTPGFCEPHPCSCEVLIQVVLFPRI